MEQALLQILKKVEVHPVLDSHLQSEDYISIDLSAQNKGLQKLDVSSSAQLQDYIWTYLKKNNAKVAFGGYMEKRGIYQRSQHFNRNDTITERNIHLGVDLWLEAGQPLYAPLDGTLHSFKNNINFGDYGPTLILQHRLNQFNFYTLYGHLSLSSLNGKELGAFFKKGQCIATLGTPKENGDYPPHLHFQIIIDLQDNFGDYPGVCSSREVDYYRENCPDPNLLLRL